MKDEFSDRHQAIKMRLAGQSIEIICQTLERSREWFRIWWRRYQAMGTAGLYDLTRARQRTALISPEMERTILAIRKRLESTYHPQTRYALMGANTIQAELKALNIRSVPCLRTIERVLQRNGVTLPRVRLARFLPAHVYPTPQAQDSNQLHQVDLVGPIYLKGQKPRYYIFVCKDVFDGAVCLQLGRSRKIEAVLAFLGECWKTLGRPKQVQFDNAREYLGWGPAARYLSRMIRLCLRFEVEPIFIPPARPQYNGSVENFNGWFQPRLFQRHFTRISALRTRIATPASYRQHAAHLHCTKRSAVQVCSTKIGWLDPRTISAAQETSEITASFRCIYRRFAYCCWSRDLHSASDHSWQNPFAQSDVQCWQAIERSIC